MIAPPPFGLTVAVFATCAFPLYVIPVFALRLTVGVAATIL